MEIINKIKNNELLSNMILNTVAAAIPILSLQIVILPLISRYMDENEYGLVVTILSVLNIVPIILGNSLNNIRLLFNNKYIEKKLEGDFGILLLADIIINSIIIFSWSYFYITIYADRNIIHICLIVVVSVLWLLREYFIVAFLIDLNYRAIFVNNILLAVGYFIGVILFFITKLWECIYIAGYIFSLFFIIKETKIWKEQLKITELWKEVAKENLIYIISCLMYRFTTYADKIILYPLLGGLNVSVYYVATLSGKIVTMLITPICGVMLSYLAKKKNSTKSSFNRVIKYGSIACIIGYFGCILVSRPVLSILYPYYVDMAMNYIYITTAVVVIGVMISLINPYILKNMTMKWQIIINFSTLIIYIRTSLTLLKVFRLMGFCIGTLIANIFKLAIMLGICLKNKDQI